MLQLLHLLTDYSAVRALDPADRAHYLEEIAHVDLAVVIRVQQAQDDVHLPPAAGEATTVAGLLATSLPPAAAAKREPRGERGEAAAWLLIIASSCACTAASSP